VIGRLEFESIDTATVLRRGVLALALLGIAGTTVELLFLRHWQSATQLLVWPAIALLAAAFVALSHRPRRRTILVVRGLVLLIAMWAVVGIGFHVLENLNAGPLDRNYAARWDSMSAYEQLFAAVTGAVGPAPTLAPGVLAEISLALFLATVRHPALASSR
jgi:hypothetical protein